MGYARAAAFNGKSGIPLPWVEMNINTSLSFSNSCYVHYDRASNAMTLQNDAGNGWIGPLTLGSGGTIQNSQCVISGPGSSAVGSGVNLTVNLALSFRAGFAGSKNIYLQTQNSLVSTGWQQKGAWTVDAAPAMIAVTPGTGNGSTQTFSFLVSNAINASYLEVNFSTTTARVNACAIHVSLTGGYAFLMNDEGTQYSSSATLGSRGTAQNSQCILSGAGSLISTSGTEVTVNLALSFKPGFAGAKSVYMHAWGQSYSTDWQLRGLWTVTPGPLAVSVSPDSGIGASQTFSFLVSDTVAYTSLSWVEMNINSSPALASSCDVHYDLSSNAFTLRNDTGGGWIGPLTPGSGGTIQNSQCVLSGAGSSAVGSGANLTVNLALSFLSGFAGSKNTYLQTQNNTASTGWQQRGAWTVNAAPAMISVTPGTGSGSTQTFSFLVSNANNASYLAVNFSTTTAWVSACAIQVSLSGGYAFLMNDAGTQYSTSVTLSSGGTAQNSQCILSGAGSSVSSSGSDVTVNLALSFKPAFAGAKNVYMHAWGQSYYTDWQQRGTWTVTNPTCTYAIDPTSESLSAGGGTGIVNLTAPWGCAWTAVSNASWLSITLGSSGSGNGTVNYAVTVNGSASGRSGTLSIASKTFTVNQAGVPVVVPPNVVDVSPGAGSEANRTFAFTFSDPRGWEDLGVLNVLINNFLDGSHSCYLAYSRPLNVLYLVNDAGDALSQGHVLNTPGSLGNNQCTVSWGSTPVAGSGNTLTLSLNLAFSSGFAGNRVIYLAARDVLDNNSGWQAMGTWSVPPSVTTSPRVSGMGPARGSGGSTTFTFQFSDSSGWQNLGVVNMLLNRFLDGRYGCYLAYARPTNALYLVDDAGDALLPGLVVNGTGTLGNSQCTITNPTVSGSGNTMTLTMGISLGAGFAGNRVWYLAARDIIETNSGWQAVGSWTVE